MAKNETRRQTSQGTRTQRADDRVRVDRALESAARWLHRRGASRQSRTARRAYDKAADAIMRRLVN